MSKIPPSVEDVVAESFKVKDVVYYEDKVEFSLQEMSPTETGPLFKDLYMKLTGMGLLLKLFHDGEDLKLLVFPISGGPGVGDRLRYALSAVTVATVLFSAWVISDGTASLLRELGMQVDVLSSTIFHSLGILAFLLVHELGHSLKWEGKYKVDLMIPAPPPPFGFGTLGDLLVRDRPFINREEQLDVALYGLLAGLSIGLIISLLGLLQSIPVPSDVASAWIEEGKAGMLPTPLIFLLMEVALSPGGGNMLLLSPLALAGLGALLISFFLSMPVLPWDGGHVASSLTSGRVRWLEWVAVLGMMLINPLLGALMLIAKLIPAYPWVLDEYSEVPQRKRRRGLFLYLLILMISVPILQ